MKRWFADASIRRKLTALMAATTTLALVLAVVALGTYEAMTFRGDLQKKLTTVADIVGRNTTAALVFGDKSVATDVLGALQAEPSIEAASVYDSHGRLFASYVVANSNARTPDDAGPIGTRLTGGRLVVVRPVLLDGDPIGTVYLRATLRQFVTRMLIFAGLTISVVLVCSIVALFVSSRLQRRISKPILDLAHTARLVTSDRNFALRAESAGGDEVGVLVQDFNRMLTEIERQDLQLRQQQESLTEEVASRTAELVAANEQLTVSVRRVEHYADQIGQLTSIGQLLQSCLSPDEVFGVLRDSMPRLFPGDSGSVTILKASGNLMETMAVWGDRPPALRIFGPDDCWAFRRGRPHLVTDLNSPLRCGHFTAEDGPTTFCVPMVAQGDNVGVLQFIFAAPHADEAADDSGAVHSTRPRLASALAEHAALALANIRLREALRSQSIVDPLTGLFNRRYLETLLERECRRATRGRRPLTVLMLDVDHFKKFNDTWGHDGGDAVLRELASLMRAHFRGDDVACRYGGEEFVVLLADASLESAFVRAEDLRQQVHRLVAQHRMQPLGSITVSIGLAALPDHGINPEDLVSAADRALYQAKSAGRDRTVRAVVPTAALARTADAGPA